MINQQSSGTEAGVAAPKFIQLEICVSRKFTDQWRSLGGFLMHWGFSKILKAV